MELGKPVERDFNRANFVEVEVPVIPSGETIALEGGTTKDNLNEEIVFADLPKSWQEHILRRKEEGKLATDKNSFTKYEILKAASSKDSFTESAVIDKLFDRVKKEKIAWADLPLEWQQMLAKDNPPANSFFDNVTVDYLYQRGARADDINKIRARIAKNKEREKRQFKKLEELKAQAREVEDVSRPGFGIEPPTIVPEPVLGEHRPDWLVEGLRERATLPLSASINGRQSHSVGWWEKTKETVKNWFGRR